MSACLPVCLFTVQDIASPFSVGAETLLRPAPLRPLSSPQLRIILRRSPGARLVATGPTTPFPSCASCASRRWRWQQRWRRRRRIELRAWESHGRAKDSVRVSAVREQASEPGLPFLSVSLAAYSGGKGREEPMMGTRRRPLDICGTRYPREL